MGSSDSGTIDLASLLQDENQFPFRSKDVCEDLYLFRYHQMEEVGRRQRL